MVLSLFDRDFDATTTRQPQADFAIAPILFVLFAVLFDGMPSGESAFNRCFLDLITIKQVVQIKLRIVSNFFSYDSRHTDKTKQRLEFLIHGLVVRNLPVQEREVSDKPVSFWFRCSGTGDLSLTVAVHQLRLQSNRTIFQKEESSIFFINVLTGIEPKTIQTETGKLDRLPLRKSRSGIVHCFVR